MNRVNSRNDFGHDESTINIVIAIIIIIISFGPTLVYSRSARHAHRRRHSLATNCLPPVTLYNISNTAHVEKAFKTQFLTEHSHPCDYFHTPLNISVMQLA